MEQQIPIILNTQFHSTQMNILVAPNSYKECISSVNAAKLMSEVLAKRGYRHVTLLPLSDGGDGFLEVCTEKYGLQVLPFTMGTCCSDSPTTVNVGYDKRMRTGYVEAADIIGLKLIPAALRKPLKLNSANFGGFLKLLSETDFGIRRLVIGLGGTGTTDLGLGLCTVFGLKLYDESGEELEVIPENYYRVHRIVLPQRLQMRIDVVHDVECALLGMNGMSRTFAGQKGANEEEIEHIEMGVENILNILSCDHGIEFKEKSFGAGGGLMVGLSLLAGIQPVPSKEFVLHQLELESAVRECDVIISGEGKFDGQSFMDKAAGIVVKEAQRQQKPVVLIVGSAESGLSDTADGIPEIFEMRPLYNS
ncbi:MAG: glycerate kinase, partial [Bacteroidota bacterium]